MEGPSSEPRARGSPLGLTVTVLSPEALYSQAWDSNLCPQATAAPPLEAGSTTLFLSGRLYSAATSLVPNPETPGGARDMGGGHGPPSLSQQRTFHGGDSAARGSLPPPCPCHCQRPSTRVSYGQAAAAATEGWPAALEFPPTNNFYKPPAS